MNIGIDVLGGDFAPEANLCGAVLARKELSSHVKLVLIGDKNKIDSWLIDNDEELDNYRVVHAPDIITMYDHPTRAIPQKPNSSISVGFDLLAKKELDAFASTGNTGAMLVGAIYKVNTIPGIVRPCITSVLPAIDGTHSIILDVGANADCKPDVLYQFAVVGSLYSKHVYGIQKPRVSLLSIGEEETKGNLLTVATYKLLSESDEIHFVGNIEGRDLFMGKADVVVCDGFTGNIVLKQAEGMYALMKKRGFIADSYFDRFNYENYGGTPILGVKGNVIIGHGISNEIAIKNMILHAHEVAISGLATKINEAFN